MSTFSEVLEARSYIPERHVPLTPQAFADDWPSRPQTDMVLGLRRISDGDIQTARAEAAKYALEMHNDVVGQIECFNDALMRWLIVRGTCDANDIRTNAPIFEGSEDNVRNALTANAIRFVWDHIERFHIETSPLVKPATDEDLIELLIYLKSPTLLEEMSKADQTLIRKLAGFVVQKFRDHDKTIEDPNETVIASV